MNGSISAHFQFIKYGVTICRRLCKLYVLSVAPKVQIPQLTARSRCRQAVAFLAKLGLVLKISTRQSGVPNPSARGRSSPFSILNTSIPTVRAKSSSRCTPLLISLAMISASQVDKISMQSSISASYPISPYLKCEKSISGQM